ncbi:AAA family ATPase [Anoxynatronum buryatiense]|uniref:Nuclease SbcCD subunit C n=1 Tax=Anoxynatronum buryatiense TaxID=489973 RepID=A0AA45WWG9_9CLOT|nr:SMC family ATPase [Anoxynatronum buryatiense]SMP53990.1 exonuclease SbcC [Anoxynatronum buryatiense]
MKLLRLTMTAFGPYRSQEVIDFEKLNAARLFVISGNTGAGKTAIFDAVCFALYGQASGTSRKDSQGLRCLLADPVTHTEVGLTFAMGQHRYRAQRRMGLVKPGNKTATGEEHLLERWVPESEATPGSEAGRWELMLERNRVREMNDTIQQLLGLDQRQFTQIVMLPQGEFEKLLLSDSTEKGVILRQIFDTGLYERFTKKLEHQAREASRQYEKQAEKLKLLEEQARSLFQRKADAAVSPQETLASLANESQQAVSVPFEMTVGALDSVFSQEQWNTRQVMAALDEELEQLQQAVSQGKEDLKALAKASQQAAEDLLKAQTINQQLEALAVREQRFQALEEEKETREKQEELLDQARKAQRIEGEHRLLEERMKEAAAQKKLLKEAEEHLKLADQEQNAANKAYEEEKDREPLRASLTEKATLLRGYLPAVKTLAEETARAQKLTLQYKVEKEALETLVNRIKKGKELRKQQKQEQETLENVLEDSETLPEEQARLTELKNQLTNGVELTQLLKEQKLNAHKALKKWEANKKDFEALEQQWVEGQALQLAAHLKDGEPCPVCGSQHHPQPASAATPPISREAVQQAGKQVEAASGVYQQAAAQAKATKEQLSKVEEWLKKKEIPLEDLTGSLENTTRQLTTLTNQVKAVQEKRNDLKKLKVEQVKSEKLLEELEQKHGAKDETLQQLKEQLNQLQGSLEARQKQIPQELHQITALEKAINEADKKREEAQQVWEKVQQAMTRSQNTFARAETKVQNARQNLKTTEEQGAHQQQVWLQALKQEDFADEAAFKQAQMSREAMATDEADLKAYREEKNLLTQQLREQREALKGAKKADLMALKEAADTLSKNLETRRQQEANREEQLRQGRQCRLQMEKEGILLETQEALRNRLTTLHRTANGSDNQERISLETYVQQTYFHQILQAANRRLRLLTDGRIELVHREEREKHGKRSGLGIEVFDMHSGSTRSVHTLSGGEKFNASLCLALGLYDIIQQESGGTIMETMFIDEGFGSLDTHESLPRAVDLLMEIQQAGRVIGIISHVEELKERLPAVLSVQKQSDGSSRTSIQVKG